MTMHMAIGALASVNEYLSTGYHPDCEYIDGVILERNLGERDHSTPQGAVFAWFYNRRKELGVAAFVEQRVQVSPTRFRVPDVCVTIGTLSEQIFTKPPFICIEILSPDDRLSAMQERVTDYLTMGVPYVWILDPKTRNAYRWTSNGMHQIQELRTDNPAISVPFEALFEA
jgi:Uma2 family endonuclease